MGEINNQETNILNTLNTDTIIRKLHRQNINNTSDKLIENIMSYLKDKIHGNKSIDLHSINNNETSQIFSKNNNLTSMNIHELTPNTREFFQALTRSNSANIEIPVKKYGEDKSTATIFFYPKPANTQDAKNSRLSLPARTNSSKKENFTNNRITVLKINFSKNSDNKYEISNIRGRSVQTAKNTQQIKDAIILHAQPKNIQITKLKESLKLNNNNGALKLEIQNQKELTSHSSINNLKENAVKQTRSEINKNFLNAGKEISKNMTAQYIEILNDKAASATVNKILNSKTFQAGFSTAMKTGQYKTALSILVSALQNAIQKISTQATIGIKLTSENKLENNRAGQANLNQELIAQLARGNKTVSQFIENINNSLQNYNVKLVLAENSFTILPYNLAVKQKQITETSQSGNNKIIFNDKAAVENSIALVGANESFRKKMERKLKEKQLKKTLKAILKKANINVDDEEFNKELEAMSSTQQNEFTTSANNILSKMNQGGGDLKVEILSELKLYLHTCLSPNKKN